ncbi:putative exodeoxyribonuclease I [Helianthus debilis subsp. tardiflorus]
MSLNVTCGMLYFPDMWVLDPKTWVWNKVKKGGMPPGPRAGFAMFVYKNRVMLYGGVVDIRYPLEPRKEKSTKDKIKKIKNEETHAPFDTSDDPMEVVTNDEDENMDCDIDDISSSMEKNSRVNGAEVVASESRWVEASEDDEEDDDDDEDSEDKNEEKDDSDEDDDDDEEDDDDDMEPGEALKDFYKRTNAYWQMAAYEHIAHTGKELRKDGFDLVESRYRKVKPILDEVSPFLDKIFLFGVCNYDLDDQMQATRDVEEKFGYNISHLGKYSEIGEKSMEKFMSGMSSFKCTSTGSRASGLRAPLKDEQNTSTKRSSPIDDISKFAYTPAKPLPS